MMGVKTVVLLVAICGGAYLLATRSDGPSAGAVSVDAPHSSTGCSASRRAIEARLRAPASAKWGDCYSTTSGGVQTVTLTVDSQNGFGALIRSQWVTTVRSNNVESVAQIK